MTARETGAVVRTFRVEPTPQQREAASKFYADNGDCFLAWVNQGDFIEIELGPLSRPQPTPAGEIVERLGALLRMTVPVPAGCVGEEGSPMSPEFHVSVQLVTDEGVHFIIRADGHSSDTLDIVVTDKGLALLAPFTPGETQVERIARTAALIEQQAATIAERDAWIEALEREGRHLLDIIDAQQRDETPAPKRESYDDANSRDERDQVFGDAVERLRSAISGARK
jgi:hypothetical protein